MIVTHRGSEALLIVGAGGSASAIPASSSASSSAERQTSSSRSRLTTTTCVPSMNSEPSRTTWPATTVPVATRMAESYFALAMGGKSDAERSRSAPARVPGCRKSQDEEAAKTEAESTAVQENGKKGGRPVKLAASCVRGHARRGSRYLRQNDINAVFSSPNADGISADSF